MKPSVIIIGTNHLIQTGDARYTPKQHAEFSSILRKTIRKSLFQKARSMQNSFARAAKNEERAAISGMMRLSKSSSLCPLK